MSFYLSELAPPRRHYAECVSTNDIARAWASDPADPAPDGALVTADFQTQGRGRRGRRWDAVPGQCALMSFVLRPTTPFADAWHLGFVASLAVANALETFGLSPLLKWPNDVLLSQSKVAGILVEVIPGSPRIGGWAAIVGIGVNVNQESFPGEDDYDTPPISLRLATGHEFAVNDVITAVSAALAQCRETYGRGDVDPILSKWRSRLAVGARLRRGVIRARLAGLHADGSAHVALEDGTFATWVSVDQEERANSV